MFPLVSFLLLSGLLVHKGCCSSEDGAGDDVDERWKKYPCHPPYYCVQKYLCRNGVINTDGDGLLDPRFGGGGYPVGHCPGSNEVCCRNPGEDWTKPSTTTSRPNHIFDCGKQLRNDLLHLIDVRIVYKNRTAAETRFGQYPWQGIVLEKPSGILQKVLNFVCGATLIHPKVVMTAAHCVEKYQHVPRSLIVRMGEYDTRSTNEPLPFQDRQVSYIKVDPHFNPGTLVNDVALLFMRRPFYPAANVNTICLPTSKNQFHAGKRCIATGFGKDAFGPRGKFQSLLKQVELPLVPNRACQHSLRSTRLGRFFNLDQSFLCAGGERGVDACTGDGGGPLVCKDDYFDKYYQVGITSWGIGCGQSGVPGVYADVANALDFINSNVGLHGRDGLDEHPEQSDEGDYDDTQDGKQESSDLSEDGRRLQELFEQAQALQVQNSTGDPSTDSLDNQKENKDEDDGPNGSIGSLARSKHKSGNSDKNEQPQDQLTISFG